MTWQEWCALDQSDRASEIAHSRISSAIQAQVHESYTRYADRQARRKR